MRRHGWIDDDDFASSLAIAQMLPGANVVNLVICMGDQLRGAAGAAVGVFGFLVGPFLAVIALSTAFDRLPDVAALEAASQGVAFAAIGLLLVICLRGFSARGGFRQVSSSSPSRRSASGCCAGR